MPNITYSLGGTSFDAVPEKLDNSLALLIRSEATLGRGVMHTVGVGGETVRLSGKYMTPAVKSAMEALYLACRETGAEAVLDDGYSQRNVLIRSFETTPLIGKTEGFSFSMELVVVS